MKKEKFNIYFFILSVLNLYVIPWKKKCTRLSSFYDNLSAKSVISIFRLQAKWTPWWNFYLHFSSCAEKIKAKRKKIKYKKEWRKKKKFACGFQWNDEYMKVHAYTQVYIYIFRLKLGHFALKCNLKFSVYISQHDSSWSRLFGADTYYHHNIRPTDKRAESCCGVVFLSYCNKHILTKVDGCYGYFLSKLRTISRGEEEEEEKERTGNTGDCVETFNVGFFFSYISGRFPTGGDRDGNSYR